MPLDFLIPPIFLIAFVFLPLRLFLLPLDLSGAGRFFWGCLVFLVPTHLRSRSERSCGSFSAPCYFSLYEIFKNLILPAGKFFRKIIAMSPNLVYTGRCIGHPSLRRKQVSSPPVRPHPAASRRGRQFCLPRLLFCCFSVLPVFAFSVLSPLCISACPALLPFRSLRSRHCCRPDFCASPTSLIGPVFPRFRLCHRHESRLFPALLLSRFPLLSGADAMPVFSLFRCRYQPGARTIFLSRCSAFGFWGGPLLSFWAFALSG